MKLKDAEIRPGFVTQIVDCQGTIKAYVAGLFDEDDPELVPPIQPFGTFSKGGFSTPEVGDAIWVLYFKDNPLFLKYIRQCNINEELNDVLKDNSKNCEVLMRRDKGTDHAQLYFNDNEGWVIQSNLTAIKILGDDSIRLTIGEPNRTLEINSGGISIGSEGASAEPAVLGNQLTECLSNLVNLLKMVSTATKPNPYTVGISQVIDAQLPMVESKLNMICSNNVTLD